MVRPALFLDRDGIINVDHGYVHRVEDFEFIPGIFDLARFAVKELHWPIIVVTNQSGIGRGKFDVATYHHLTAWMRERFENEGAPLTAVYYCPYHPVHGIGQYRMDHAWRKPKPGMFLQAAADYEIDLGRSVSIGNSESDDEAAAAAGISARIRLTESSSSDSSVAVPNLDAALRYLKNHAHAL